MSFVTESIVEDAALAWLEGLGYAVLNGPAIAADEPGAERTDFCQMVLEKRLQQVLARLNPDLPIGALDDPYQVTLAALRDTLLPKLLSGEVRVKDAERFIEEVT